MTGLRSAVLAAAVVLTAAVVPAASTAAATPQAVALSARVNARFATADHAGADPLVASRPAAGTWELFDLVPVDPGGWVALRSRANGKYVTAENAGASPLVANRTGVGSWEQFQLQARPDGAVSIFARANNRYVTADNAGSSPLVANRTAVGGWEEFDVTTEGGQPAAGAPFTRPTALVQALDDGGRLDVLPLGDSWTGGNNTDGWSGCGAYTTGSDAWRQYAAGRLVAALPQASYEGAWQRGCHGNTWNSGFGGRRLADGLADDTYRQWLTGLQPNNAPPDVVIMALGINDFWHDNIDAATALDRVDELAGKVLTFDWRIRLIVVDVPPIAVPPDGQAQIAAYNAAMPSRLAHLGYRVGFASWSSAWTPANTVDGGFHPNDAGNQQIAAAIMDSAAWNDWYGVQP